MHKSWQESQLHLLDELKEEFDELMGRRHLLVWILHNDGIWSRKMPDMKVGQQYLATVTSSDPTVAVPLGLLAATVDNPGVARASAPDPANAVAIQAVGVGSFSVRYSAPGFNPVSEGPFNVTAAAVVPTLVVTDGPVTG